MPSPAQQLADLVARFRPDAAAGIEAVYQLCLIGDDNLHPEPSRRVHPEPSRRVHPEPSRRVHPEPSRRVHPEPSRRPALFTLSAAEGSEAEGEPASGEHIWHLIIADRQCHLASGPARDPDVAITIRVEDWDDLASGRLDPFSALLAGRLQLEGDLELATRLQAMFGL
jgi:hypothetical protein